MPFAGDMKLKNFLILAGGGVLLLGATVCGFGWLTLDLASDAVERMPEPAPVAVAPAPAPEVKPAAPVPEPALPAGVREVDQVVLSYQGKNIGSAKLKDVTKGKPYKVNVYQDEGNSTANRAKVDLDRDDKWDEKFTFEADSVQRQVAPADDEDYTAVYRWTGTEWASE